MSETKHVLVTKMEEPHVEDCWALEAVAQGEWASPWWIPGLTVYRAKDGSHRGRTVRFQQWECNSTNCGAVLLVDELGLVDFVTRHIVKETSE